jgi:hypothetical protein
MTEAELCLRLEEFYSEWEVYKEVPCGGRLDMYVKKGVLWCAVEVKMQLSTTLIMQAYRHKKHSHYSYIAIPRLKGRYDGVEICKMLGIGVLEYSDGKVTTEGWSEIAAPSFQRRIKPYRVLDRMKKAVAGVQHNTESEFKVSLQHMIWRIQRAGGRIAIKDFFEKDHYHYSSHRSAKQCITRICGEGGIKEFRIEGNDFVLNSEQNVQGK